MPARHRTLLATVGAAVLAAALLTQPGAASGASGWDGEPVGHPIEGPAARAAQVLEEADGLLRGSSSGRDASLVLLELARSRTALPAARRAEADRILARPTDNPDPQQFGYRAGAQPTAACQDGFCVHWARQTSDAPDLSDGNGNGRPDYVDLVFTTLAEVSGTYAGAGYRRPVADGIRGGGLDQFDVYLVDSGTRGDGIYGYCAPEGVTSAQQRSATAYCALDNDFAEFPSHTPTENLQVTLAHEYFHAVQLAYDLTEDPWFLESTATWVEDEVYDGVNDNVQYLRNSPMSQPGVPLDQGEGMRVYGSWIFFRHLSEVEPRAQGGLPTIIREIWERAAGPAYSIQAVEAVLGERGRSMTATVARFSAANRHPRSSYAEGSRYPATTPESSARVARGQSRRAALTLDHLGSGTLRYRPDTGASRRAGRLRITVDLPRRSRPTAAVLTVRQESGRLRTRVVRVDRSGGARITLPFAAGRVRYVDVTLVNAATRYRCGRGTVHSCRGRSLDDDLTLRVQVRALA
ncbi:MXAN_6640 family putative metalloprotease [Nocardioides sp. W7]|uniref:MXAN_6640 family putative metalloprotease n=1 Tax=Nocardioides sp. W7 TaxID=2931390 RepID=UPI001FD19B0F|nr:MXAN_6640 family putative metalloprotease [Nocardioides sp. W7]